MHKISNVLSKVPKSIQPAVISDLRNIWQAETRAAAETAINIFVVRYGPKYEKAVTCLTKDREALLNRAGFTGGCEVSMDGAHGKRHESKPLPA